MAKPIQIEDTNVIFNRTFGTDIKNTNNIIFKDENLNRVVRQAINKPSGDITRSDVYPLTKIDLEGKGIKDISGIEYLENLTNLDISNNDIDNIYSLKYLKYLQILNLSKNKISDISPLEKLTSLYRK